MLLARLAGRSASWGRAVAGLVATGTCAVVVGRDAAGPVGAVLVSAHGGLATYLAGAAIADSRPYGKLLLPLVGAIAWARARGVPTFDVGGLPVPGDIDPKRKAIARFKACLTLTGGAGRAAPALAVGAGPSRRAGPRFVDAIRQRAQMSSLRQSRCEESTSWRQRARTNPSVLIAER